MPSDPWLPKGMVLPDGSRTRVVLFEGNDWQLYDTSPRGEALVVRQSLACRWVDDGLLDRGTLSDLTVGPEVFAVLFAGTNHRLAPVEACPAPRSQSEAHAFAVSLAETRARAPLADLHDGLYVERYSRILPLRSGASGVSDDVILGTFLTGGVNVSALTVERLQALVRGWSAPELEGLARSAGLKVAAASSAATDRAVQGTSQAGPLPPERQFHLAGRALLERFFREHVIEIIEHAERYKLLGIGFPSAIVLHGPPGGGKTYAVERLVEYLGWPSFSIESSSIGSPYIHETGRKIGQIFDEASRAAPCVLVIDEMESYLADRQGSGGGGHHRVEEVAEFLRRIPEAVQNRVLIVGMTNRIEMIDPAILRRGRFDHVVEVGMPTREEVHALLGSLVEKIPHADLLSLQPLAAALTGRALSDAAFVVREGARLAARSGKTALDRTSLDQALELLPPRPDSAAPTRPIGFR